MINVLNGIGLNLRLKKDLWQLFEQAQQFKMPFFQSFLTYPKTGEYISHTLLELRKLKELKNEIPFFAHASYRINLASENAHSRTMHYFKKELMLAKKLGCHYFILHPGAVYNISNRALGIETIAKTINKVLKREEYPIILLENVAFSARSIGGPLEDLAAIRNLIEKPERVKFCIDTAHAYGYGYDISHVQHQNDFINLITTQLGLDSVALIHLNDTKEALASQRDKHDIPGEGNIGKDALKRFILDERLVKLPVVLELPEITDIQMNAIYEMICGWRSTKKE